MAQLSLGLVGPVARNSAPGVLAGGLKARCHGLPVATQHKVSAGPGRQSWRLCQGVGTKQKANSARQIEQGLRAQASSMEVGTACFKVTLTPAEATQWLRLLEIPNPDGAASVIVVEAVAIGSRAQQEGVQAGQRVLAVSHPVEKEVLWELQPGASLSRVKDAVRVTRATSVEMVFTADSVADSWWEERQRAAAEAEAQEKPAPSADAQNGGVAGNGTALQQALESPLLNSLAGEAQAQESTSGAEDTGRGLTIAEQLENQMTMDLSEEQKKVQAYQRRMARRKEREELEAQRDDGPFFALVFAAFFLPAAIILGIAIGTGYLDDLQSHQF